MASISLDKKAALDILSKLILHTDDAGPAGQGWKSDELLILIEKLEIALGIPEKDRYGLN